ncbi:Pre-rRNA-processing protein ipi3 [Cryptotrichosporon argae]
MVPVELVLSLPSASASTSTAHRPASSSTPAVHLHDLLTAAPVRQWKHAAAERGAVAVCGGAHGGVWAVGEKGVVGVWAWGKEQQVAKLHTQEKACALAVSPNGLWLAAGSETGHLYLWEIASGQLVASLTPHYRALTSLAFTPDSAVLVTASPDARAHVFLVARLLDPADEGRPYGTFGDHTLGITAVAVGRTAGVGGGRCWTASEDGTVKMWSMHPPFDLLATFALPPAAVPAHLAVDPLERFFYVAAGSRLFHFPMFVRRDELRVEAVGGDAAVKAESPVISLDASETITALALSLSATHLLTGTSAGDIHVHALPSHQRLHVVAAHPGPVAHLSTLPRPPTLVGGGGGGGGGGAADWVATDVRPLERARRSGTDVWAPLGTQDVDALRPTRRVRAGAELVPRDTHDDRAALEAENRKLRAALERAVRVNERMWAGVVELKMDEYKAGEDVEMDAESEDEASEDEEEDEEDEEEDGE